MRKIGVAVVGSGRIGSRRAELLAGAAEVKFLALSDLDPERAKKLAEAVGANFHSGNNEEVICHPEVDAVVVSTSEFAHADPVCTALEKGKPVLVEKPLALSLEDAERILETKRKYGGSLYVGYTQRQRRRFLNAKEQIRQGKLGRLLTARMSIYNPVTSGAEIYKRSPHASPVTDTLTYMVDIALWYFEGRRPKRVYAQGGGEIFPDQPAGVGDWAWAILSLDDGSTISLGCCWILPENWPANICSIGMEIMGQDGAIIIDDSHKDVIMASKVPTPSVYAPGASSHVVYLETMMAGDWALGEFWGPMRDETRVFLEHVSTGKEVTLATAEEARTTLEITLAIEKSAAENRPLNFPLR